jgi:hypothetical protein
MSVGLSCTDRKTVLKRSGVRRFIAFCKWRSSLNTLYEFLRRATTKQYIAIWERPTDINNKKFDLKVTALWYIATCRLVAVYQRFGDVYNGRSAHILRGRSTITRLHDAAFLRPAIFIFAAVEPWIQYSRRSRVFFIDDYYSSFIFVSVRRHADVYKNFRSL